MQHPTDLSGLPTLRRPLLPWLLLLLSGLAALCAAGGAWAQRGGDDGEYQILHARYGTAQRNIDVTPRLQELARQDRSFRMGNNTFNADPDPGRVKTLRIYAKGRNGQERTFEYNEGSVVDGSQFTGWRGGQWGRGVGGSAGGAGSWEPGRGDAGEYRILQARYGTAGRNVDVTRRLQELARSDRRFRVANTSFGVDPDPGQIKVLRIFARGKNGQTRMFETAEGGDVDGALFSGWGGGNWGNNGSWAGGWGDLRVISATYGAGKRTRDVTARLREQIRGERIDVTVNNTLAGGDPAPNTAKQLVVNYSVGGAKARQLRVQENARLSIP